jgi:hypothetical protein
MSSTALFYMLAKEVVFNQGIRSGLRVNQAALWGMYVQGWEERLRD